MMGRQDRAAMAYRCGVDLDEANLSTRSAACNSVLHTQRRVLKARTQRRNYTELNWHGLVFDELTNELMGWRVRNYVTSYVGHHRR